MESKDCTEYSDTLFVRAEEIADVLHDMETELGIEQEAEANLRDSIAEAILARGAYLALLYGADEPPRAPTFLAQAKAALDQAEHRLRHRVCQAIAEISILLDDDELLNVADYVLSIGA